MNTDFVVQIWLQGVIYKGKCPFYVCLALHTENDDIFTSFYFNAFQIHALNYAVVSGLHLHV